MSDDDKIVPINHAALPDTRRELELQSWPEPEPLVASLKPVAHFNPAMLPDSIRPWIEDIAKRMQCPTDFPAAASMVSLSAVIGRKAGINPKRHDDWLVVPNLWGLLVGRPSVMKTPTLEAVLKPLKRLEIQSKNEFQDDVVAFGAEADLSVIRKENAKGEAKKLMKEGNEAKARYVLIDAEDKQPAKPTRRRYLVNDATIEKLGELLNENPSGLLLKRDEMSGFLKSLDRDDRKSDRAFYLEAFDGTGRYTYDRIGRGTIDIEAVTLSLIGTIQPGVLRPYIASAIAGGLGDDGLIQRMQLAVYPDISKTWRYVDDQPDKEARTRAFDVFRSLSEIAAADGDDIRTLHFDDEAQIVFIEWLTDLETTLRTGDLHPALESHLTKYRSLIPSLALIIELANKPDSQSVGETALIRACGWCTYLLSHAERIYSSATDNETVNAQTILDKIEANKLGNPFKLMHVQQSGWSGLTDNETIKSALHKLCEHDFLREEKITTGQRGRPSVNYHVNPKFWSKEGGVSNL